MSDHIIEVHKADIISDLWFKIGSVHSDHIDWHSSHRYQQGISPSVSMNSDDHIVSVYTNTFGTMLYYIVGKRDGHDVNWGDEHTIGYGNYGQVALNDEKVVVEVHKDAGYAEVEYRVGYLDTSKNTIDWHSNHTINSGENPSITMDNDGTVVIFYEGTIGYNLYYCVGVVDGTVVSWGEEYMFEGIGVNPSIAMNQDNTVVAQWGTSSDDMRYRVGTVDPQKKKISFHSDHSVGVHGGSNSINFTSKDDLIHVDQTDGATALYYCTGHLKSDGKSISWDDQDQYTTGSSPDVS